MVKSFLIILLTLNVAYADIFDFESKGDEIQSRIPELVGKLKSMNVQDDSAYEESFNKTVRAIENAMEEEKLYCSGEAASIEGKTVPAAQKQLCMRELKKHYLEASMAIFDLKKKYLVYLHQKQMEKLNEVQKKIRADIEKNF